jgi:hypothetical protein
MSETLFKPRKAQKIFHSDNPKSKRNREAEASKSGFKAAEMKARNAFRTSKSRHLAKLHRTLGWTTLTLSQREDREADIIEGLESKLTEKLQALDKLWGGSPDNEHIEHNVEHEAHDGSPENMMESKILDSTDVNEEVDDKKTWKDEQDTVRQVFKKYEGVYDERIKKWEERSLLEALENNQFD